MKQLLSISLIVVFASLAYQQRQFRARLPDGQGQVPSDEIPALAVSIPPPISSPSKQYRDGSYTGELVDAFYGLVQVKAIVTEGRITDVQFLKFPNERQTSKLLSSQAVPLLRQEAIQAQSARVDGVSGASATSQAFVQSLDSALKQAER